MLWTCDIFGSMLTEIHPRARRDRVYPTLYSISGYGGAEPAPSGEVDRVAKEPLHELLGEYIGVQGKG